MKATSTRTSMPMHMLRLSGKIGLLSERWRACRLAKGLMMNSLPTPKDTFGISHLHLGF